MKQAFFTPADPAKAISARIFTVTDGINTIAYSLTPDQNDYIFAALPSPTNPLPDDTGSCFLEDVNAAGISDSSNVLDFPLAPPAPPLTKPDAPTVLSVVDVPDVPGFGKHLGKPPVPKGGVAAAGQGKQFRY